MRGESNGGTVHSQALENWYLLKFKLYNKLKFHPKHKESPLACDATLKLGDFPGDARKNLCFLSLSIS